MPRYDYGDTSVLAEKRSLSDRLSTLKQIGGGVLLLVGFAVGTAYATGKKAGGFINDVGDAYYKHEYGDTTDENI